MPFAKGEQDVKGREAALAPAGTTDRRPSRFGAELAKMAGGTRASALHPDTEETEERG